MTQPKQSTKGTVDVTFAEFTNWPTAKRRPRRAAVLLIVLGCLVIASALLASMMRNALLARQQSRMRHYQLQADWLAESAIERAIFQLREDKDYPGETWRIGADDFESRQGAIVNIRVSRSSQTKQSIIEVIADYPDHPQRRVRKRKQIVAEIGEPNALTTDDS